MDKPHSEIHLRRRQHGQANQRWARVGILCQGSIGEYTEKIFVKKSRILECLLVEKAELHGPDPIDVWILKGDCTVTNLSSHFKSLGKQPACISHQWSCFHCMHVTVCVRLCKPVWPNGQGISLAANWKVVGLIPSMPTSVLLFHRWWSWREKGMPGALLLSLHFLVKLSKDQNTLIEQSL